MAVGDLPQFRIPGGVGAPQVNIGVPRTASPLQAILGATQQVLQFAAPFVAEREKAAKRLENDLKTSNVQNRFAKAQGVTRDFFFEENKKVGLDAKGHYTRAKEFMDSTFSEATEGMELDEKNVFQRKWEPYVNSYLTKASGYETKQIAVYRNEARINLQRSQLDEAILNHENPESHNRFIMEGLGLIKDEGKEKGWSKEKTDTMQSQFMANVHKGVLDQYIANRDDLGMAGYLTENEDKMNASTKAQWNNEIRALLDRNHEREQLSLAQSASDGYFAEFGLENKAEAERMARKEYKGSDREIVLREIDALWLDEQRAEEGRLDVQQDALMSGINDSAGHREALHWANSAEDPGRRSLLLKAVQAKFGERPLTRADKLKSKVNSFKMMAAIEGNVFRNVDHLAAAMIQNDIVGEDTDALLEYFSQGGQVGNFKVSQVESVLKSVVGGNKTMEDYPTLWDALISRARPGQEITDSWLTSNIRTLVGEIGEENGDFIAENMTYLEAVSQNMGSKWLPKVEAFELLQLQKEMKTLGISTRFEKDAKRYKKYFKLQITPEPDEHTQRWFKSAVRQIRGESK